MKKLVNITANELFQNNNFYLLKSSASKFPNLEKNSFLITTSGGQDSSLTFFILFHSSKNVRLESLYCNHFWQIKNFISSKVLFEINSLFEIPYTINFPEKIYLTENESRQWRKKTSYRISKLNYNYILITGQTETDNLEKNFNNLLRGTSLTGFSEKNFLYSTKIIENFFPQTTNQNPFANNLEKSTERTSRKFFSEKNNSENFLKKNTKNFVPTLIKNLETKNFHFFNSRTKSLKRISKRVFTRKLYFKRSLEEEKSYSYCFSNQFFRLNHLFIKPIKKIRRSSISKIVKVYQLPITNDLTNFSSNFSRNKIRHQFIPFSRVLINQNSEILLTNFFSLLRIENEVKNEITKKLYFTCRKLTLPSKEKSFTHSKLRKLFRKTKQNNNLTNKLFLEYKNINLNYLQNQTLKSFLIKD